MNYIRHPPLTRVNPDLIALLLQKIDRANERDVRKSLRKIAEQSLCTWIVFFGKQPKIIPQCEQTLHHLTSFLFAA